MSRLASGPTQLPIQWVPAALSMGVKRPGREADHSPPSSAEVISGAASPLQHAFYFFTVTLTAVGRSILVLSTLFSDMVSWLGIQPVHRGGGGTDATNSMEQSPY
jgi:hypothetical protein